jgi:predicted O-linked N-acetylglucosamine transferase (SPINDLY family)
VHAAGLSRFAASLPPAPLPPAPGRLKMGYICYDFNDHPTAHLAEGLFLHHNR